MREILNRQRENMSWDRSASR